MRKSVQRVPMIIFWDRRMPGGPLALHRDWCAPREGDHRLFDWALGHLGYPHGLLANACLLHD